MYSHHDSVIALVIHKRNRAVALLDAINGYGSSFRAFARLPDLDVIDRLLKAVVHRESVPVRGDAWRQ